MTNKGTNGVDPPNIDNPQIRATFAALQRTSNVYATLVSVTREVLVELAHHNLAECGVERALGRVETLCVILLPTLEESESVDLQILLADWLQLARELDKDAYHS